MAFLQSSLQDDWTESRGIGHTTITCVLHSRKSGGSRRNLGPPPSSKMMTIYPRLDRRCCRLVATSCRPLTLNYNRRPLARIDYSAIFPRFFEAIHILWQSRGHKVEEVTNTAATTLRSYELADQDSKRPMFLDTVFEHGYLSRYRIRSNDIPNIPSKWSVVEKTGRGTAPLP
jgi:hypothetical protein